MRQVRRKTMDIAAKEYLLKAKNEGLELSWNKYEAMLPQDGFSLLGLSCHECLQGPCRLNPFRPEETNTICGLDKEDLTLGWLTRQVERNSDLVAAGSQLIVELREKYSTGGIDSSLLKAVATKWSLDFDEDGKKVQGLIHKHTNLGSLVKGEKSCIGFLTDLSARQIDLLALNADLAELLYGKCESNARLVGLALLKEKAVNICLEGATPSLQKFAIELMDELEEEAIRQGASDGINVVLAGDFSSHFNLNTLCNEGTVEFAILTGLVDLYVIGHSLGRGRIPARSYHTVVASGELTKAALKEQFIKGIEAYTKRDNAKIKGTAQVNKAIAVSKLDPLNIKQLLDEDLLNGICVLGGGSNLKLTEDLAALEIVRGLSHKNILCLAYGNTAVSLAKYGYLNPEAAENRMLADALGVEAGPLVYCVGGESNAGRILEILRVTRSKKVAAVFPELTNPRDLQMALAVAQVGIKVFTGIQLPVMGSAEVAKSINEIIEYQGPKELPERVSEFFKGTPPTIEVLDNLMTQV